jgi:hypothetical protein
VGLAELAATVLRIPGVGQMQLSPKKGPTYANLPTFVLVTFDQPVEIDPGGAPYVTDTAAVQGAAATVWIVANPMQLAVSDTSAQLFSNCGYLGSIEMELHPAQVARTGANGTADCEYGPPPAQCHAVPGANLNRDVWNRNVVVYEIQAANGTG